MKLLDEDAARLKKEEAHISDIRIWLHELLEARKTRKASLRSHTRANLRGGTTSTSSTRSTARSSSSAMRTRASCVVHEGKSKKPGRVRVTFTSEGVREICANWVLMDKIAVEVDMDRIYRSKYGHAEDADLTSSTLRSQKSRVMKKLKKYFEEYQKKGKLTMKRSG